MQPHEPQLTAEALLNEVLPRLGTMERLVKNTLTAMIEAADNPLEVLRLREKQTEFQLDLQMIRMNLHSLMRRHGELLKAAERGDERAARQPLTLDAHEAVAIKTARELYERLQAYQQG